MYICICIYIYIYIQIYIHTYIHIYTCVYTYIYIYIRTHIHTIHIYTYMLLGFETLNFDFCESKGVLFCIVVSILQVVSKIRSGHSFWPEQDTARVNILNVRDLNELTILSPGPRPVYKFCKQIRTPPIQLFDKLTSCKRTSFGSNFLGRYLCFLGSSHPAKIRSRGNTDKQQQQ